MDYLFHAGYRCLALRDLLPFFQAGARTPPRTVVLTFDDGYDNFYREAYPILAEHSFSATVFVVTGEVGGMSRWDAGFESRLLDWSQIRELNQLGIEFGSHTVTHPRLTHLALKAARQELEDSRGMLEQQLGTSVSSFAYPYGDWNVSVQQLVEETQYFLGCSIIRGNLHAPQDRFHLKRVPVDEWTTASRFRRRLSRTYDYTSRLQRLNRRLRGKGKSIVE
jgi:peptidoglycan/xylan/chitin deacetylase (PgdA/CDA1 family)